MTPILARAGHLGTHSPSSSLAATLSTGRRVPEEGIVRLRKIPSTIGIRNSSSALTTSCKDASPSSLLFRKNARHCACFAGPAENSGVGAKRPGPEPQRPVIFGLYYRYPLLQGHPYRAQYRVAAGLPNFAYNSITSVPHIANWFIRYLRSSGRKISHILRKHPVHFGAVLTTI